MAKIGPEELSIFNLDNVTNNAAESYHGKLKSIIKSSHPRIWNFMTVINDIIADYDNEMVLIRQGREITRSSKKKNMTNSERQSDAKKNYYVGVTLP